MALKALSGKAQFSAKSRIPVPSAVKGRSPRIVLYSHDTLGFGHLRRNLLLAGVLRTCCNRPDVLMIAGMREAGAFELPEGVDCISLPAYEKSADGSYHPRDLGVGLADLVALRSATILAAIQSYDPDLVIVDNVPRGAMRELDPVLKALRKRARARIVLGLRDVIDRPSRVRSQWLRERNFEAIRRFYDAVWVYGDKVFYDTVGEYGLDGELGHKAHFVGYLDHTERLKSPEASALCEAVISGDPRPYVLCSVGGGRDGGALCRAFVGAALPPGHFGVLVTGSQMARSMRNELQRLGRARSEMLVLDFVKEPIAIMARASRVVAMGGYNTICEALSLGVPTLVIPRSRPREEQLIRAERLAERGLISTLHCDELSPTAITDWLSRPASKSVSARSVIDFEGLARVRDLAEDMLAPVNQATAV